MLKILLTLVCGLFLLTSSCKRTANEVEFAEFGTFENPSSTAFPLYEERVFEHEKVFAHSTINTSLIKKLKPWDEKLLLKLFAPKSGENTLFTYKAKYSIPKNIDNTEGDYTEYLIVEVEPNGTVVDSLLYEGGPNQGPIFWYLFRGNNSGILINDLSSLAQLNLKCPFKSRGGDLLHNGTGRINKPIAPQKKE